MQCHKTLSDFVPMQVPYYGIYSVIHPQTTDQLAPATLQDFRASVDTRSDDCLHSRSYVVSYDAFALEP